MLAKFSQLGEGADFDHLLPIGLTIYKPDRFAI